MSKSLGLSISIQGQRNPLDTRGLETSLSQGKFYDGVVFGSTPNPDPTQIPYSKYGNWKVDKNSWLLGNLLAGGYGQVSPRKSKNLLFTAKAMIGIAYVQAPELNAQSTSDTAVVQFKQSDGSAFGFAYSVAGGFKLKFTERIYLLTQVEFFGTNNLLFKDIETSFTSARYSNGSPTSWSKQTAQGNGKQKIGTVNLNFGIGIIL